MTAVRTDKSEVGGAAKNSGGPVNKHGGSNKKGLTLVNLTEMMMTLKKA